MKPNHLVVIPDGNRRWAKKKGLKSWEGYQEGAKEVQETSFNVFEQDIKYFTFWALSEDNLIKRPKQEISFLLKLIHVGIKEFYKQPWIQEKGVAINFYGNWRKYFDKKMILEMKKIQKETSKNTNFYLSVLIAYDGKEELVSGIKGLIKSKHTISFENVKKHVWTNILPDVDLVIRTGTEEDPHWSGNLLMFQTGYSQLYFKSDYWPDFNLKTLKSALTGFEKRERRTGK